MFNMNLSRKGPSSVLNFLFTIDFLYSGKDIELISLLDLPSLMFEMNLGFVSSINFPNSREEIVCGT